MNTVRNRRPADPRQADLCEERHRPIRGLAWQLLGAFVMVVLTLALAGAAHMTGKADGNDLTALAARTRSLEASMADIQSRLAELTVGQQHMREDLRYIRNRLDEERKR